MQNNLIPFVYEDNTVRTIAENGEPWFVASDVAKILGYSEASAMTRTLDDDEKGLRIVQTLGGEQRLLAISEPGLYSAILRSHVDGAKRFKRWVTHEVLPQIRRQGYYAAERTQHLVNAQVREAQMRLELLQAARGLIDEKHLEAKARVELARGLGELPQLETGTRPLYTQDFLKEKGLSHKQMRSVAGTFGKRLKAAYTLKHGREPGKYALNLSNGQTKQVCAYTEQDRGLMNSILGRILCAAGRSMTTFFRIGTALTFLTLAARQAIGVEYPIPTHVLIARLGLMVFGIAAAAFFLLEPFEEKKTNPTTTRHTTERGHRAPRRPVYQDLRPKGEANVR